MHDPVNDAEALWRPAFKNSTHMVIARVTPALQTD